MTGASMTLFSLPKQFGHLRVLWGSLHHSHQPEWQNYPPAGASVTRLTPSGNSERCGKCSGTLHVAIIIYQSG